LDTVTTGFGRFYAIGNSARIDSFHQSMNFRDLEYLVAVADLGHFGQAAAHCHVSQSALSLQLKKLEAELGVQLIERTSRRVVVAPAGRLSPAPALIRDTS